MINSDSDFRRDNIERIYHIPPENLAKTLALNLRCE